SPFDFQAFAGWNVDEQCECSPCYFRRRVRVEGETVLLDPHPSLCTLGCHSSEIKPDALMSARPGLCEGRQFPGAYRDQQQCPQGATVLLCKFRPDMDFGALLIHQS